jgi:hypothetical protein
VIIPLNPDPEIRESSSSSCSSIYWASASRKEPIFLAIILFCLCDGEISEFSRTTTSNLEKGRFSWVRNEHFSGSARCGKRSLRAWWACAAMAVLRAWCEANPTTSMAPASRGWVIGGSRSRLGSGLRWNGWRARPRLGECRFNPHVGPSLHKRFKIRE